MAPDNASYNHLPPNQRQMQRKKSSIEYKSRKSANVNTKDKLEDIPGS